ncbi:hypothetical protein HDU80_003705 [Chytriomyces hyalinus]|nr:hypothetical protein HDU80_003705 [Chytriomyces hyalinus]
MTEITTDRNPFAQLVDLTANGNVLFATDDFFQVAETLILKQDPVWDEKKFTPFGKWMDGWETRRKRTEGHDWSIVKLGLSGTISGLHIDTAFFTGNQTPRISIQAACLEKDLALCRRSEMGSCSTNEETKAADSIQTHLWEEILPMVALRPGYPGERHHYFGVTSAKRINYFPDGGVARLRAYGTVVKDWSRTSKTDLVDLIALENGGTPVSSSNSHYGTPFNLISKPESEGMYDGWETDFLRSFMNGFLKLFQNLQNADLFTGVVSLGDRHGENVLFDELTGDCVHVDLNCLFEKGLTFEKPEKVPFRLTQNMVDAFGVTGTEGVFRKACEMALRVLRTNRESLLAVLETFIHDPLCEWSKRVSGNSKQNLAALKEKEASGEKVNEEAVKHLRRIGMKLKGMANEKQALPLSIEGQVQELIAEATDPKNLGVMYVGE